MKCRYFRCLQQWKYNVFYITNDILTIGHWADRIEEYVYTLTHNDIDNLNNKKMFIEITEKDYFLENL